VGNQIWLKEVSRDVARLESEDLFCDIDDFCTDFAPCWQRRLLAARPEQRNRKFGLCLSE
jgi:hypothetical protein